MLFQTHQVVAAFPELEVDLRGADGACSNQVAVLAIATENAISRGKFDVADRIAAFLYRSLRSAENKTKAEGLVASSFLNYWDLMESKNGRIAIRRFPEGLVSLLRNQRT